MYMYSVFYQKKVHPIQVLRSLSLMILFLSGYKTTHVCTGFVDNYMQVIRLQISLQIIVTLRFYPITPTQIFIAESGQEIYAKD